MGSVMVLGYFFFYLSIGKVSSPFFTSNTKPIDAMGVDASVLKYNCKKCKLHVLLCVLVFSLRSRQPLYRYGMGVAASKFNKK